MVGNNPSPFFTYLDLLCISSSAVPLNLNFLFTRETHQINNPLGRPEKFWLAEDVGIDKKDLTI